MKIYASLVVAVMCIIAALAPVPTHGPMSAGCSPAQQQTAKTAEGIVVKIADDVCQVEAQQPSDPSWVALACTAEGVIFHVLLPATQATPTQQAQAKQMARAPQPAPATSGTP